MVGEQKSGAGYGAIEDLSISILIIGDEDREDESRAMLQSLSSRHKVSVFAPAKTNFFTKFLAARAVSNVTPHVIHAVGLKGAAASAMSLANGTSTALTISLSTKDIENIRPKTLIRAAKQAAALIVESESAADKLREAGINRDIYVTEPPKPDNHESQRFFLGAIEIVYGRIIDPEKLPQPPQDTDGAPLISIGDCSKGNEA